MHVSECLPLVFNRHFLLSAATVQPLVASESRQSFSKAAILPSLSFGTADGELRGFEFLFPPFPMLKTPQKRRWTWIKTCKSHITAIVRDTLHNDSQPSPTKSGFFNFPSMFTCHACRAGPLVTVEFFQLRFPQCSASEGQRPTWVNK